MEQKITGYPSIDKPWLKYYSEEAINAPLPECTIYDYLWENNKDYPHDIAINYFGNEITYGKLFEQIHISAKAFANMGVKQGDIVVACTLNTPEMVYCTYALNYLGAIIDYEYPTVAEKELYSSLQKTNAKVLILFDRFIEKFSRAHEYVDNTIYVSPASEMPFIAKTLYKLKMKNSLPKSTDMAKIAAQGSAAHNQYTKGSPAILVHTGGTTGTPKGALLSNDSFNAIAHSYRLSGMKYNRGDTILHCIPPFHAYGFSIGIHMPLCLGMTVCMTPKIDGDTISGMFAKINPNHFVGAGPHVKAIMENPKVQKLDLSKLSTIAIGGAATNDVQENQVNEFLSKRNASSRLVVGFGMTEACATVCTNMNHCSKTGTAGIPFPMVNAKIVDTDTGKEMPYDTVGELWISSPSCMIEYFKDEKETSATIKADKQGNRWIKTGDLASIDADGFITIKGRIKRVCSTRDTNSGMIYKLHPDYIESDISKMDGVSECAVVCLKDAARVNIAIAFVVCQDTNIDITQILRHCREHLPEHMVPQRIILLSQLPLMSNGKVDYRALEKKIETEGKE